MYINNRHTLYILIKYVANKVNNELSIIICSLMYKNFNLKEIEKRSRKGMLQIRLFLDQNLLSKNC